MCVILLTTADVCYGGSAVCDGGRDVCYGRRDVMCTVDRADNVLWCRDVCYLVGYSRWSRDVC